MYIIYSFYNAIIEFTRVRLKMIDFYEKNKGEYEKLQMQVDEFNGLQSGVIHIGTFSSRLKIHFASFS